MGSRAIGLRCSAPLAGPAFALVGGGAAAANPSTGCCSLNLRGRDGQPDLCPTCYQAPIEPCSRCQITTRCRRTTPDRSPICVRCQLWRQADQAARRPRRDRLCRAGAAAPGDHGRGQPADRDRLAGPQPRRPDPGAPGRRRAATDPPGARPGYRQPARTGRATRPAPVRRRAPAPAPGRLRRPAPGPTSPATTGRPSCGWATSGSCCPSRSAA
jgi:hypothetical protein